MKPGKFIVFEGIDGSGKGTQILLLADYLKKNKIGAVLTKEHTRDLAVGKLIEKTVNREEKMNPLALQLCFTADRVDHFEKVIGPAIDEGKIVISDRYYLSTVAYTDRDKKELMMKLNESVVPKADLTFFIDVSPEVAIERLDKSREEKTIFEKYEKLQQSRKNYWWAMRKMKGKVVVMDGSEKPEIIHENILKILRRRKII
ncbi:MAG TPA: dTMP kinase [Candidatus Woesebacteria bacterium]|nr:dTMP kinase [Candidatus Woesebacteria bacterium]HOG37652.1 dTMP kinase [Candidatus Woesebacteria bacterium]